MGAKDFRPLKVDTGSGAHPASCPMVSRDVKLTAHAYHSEVKNEWIRTFVISLCLLGVDREAFQKLN